MIRAPLFISTRGKWILLFLKFSIVLLIVAALCDPKIDYKLPSSTSKVIFLLDNSPSIDLDIKKKVLLNIAGEITRLKGKVDCGIMIFDQAGYILDAKQLSDVEKINSLEEAANFLSHFSGKSSTNLVNSLETARLIFRPSDRGRMVIFSDGVDTSSKACDYFMNGNLSDIPIDTVCLKGISLEKFSGIQRFILPEESFSGESVKAVVQFHSLGSEKINLAINGTDETTLKREFIAEPGWNSWETSFKPLKSGGHVYSVELSSQNGKVIGKEHSLMQIQSLPQILLFEENKEQGEFFRELLQVSKIDFISVNNASRPASLIDLIGEHPAIVLNNLPKSFFSPSELVKIRDSVKEGTGLLMIGGPKSFGQGEYTDTPVEEAMPVKMPKRTVSEGLAIVLLLDSSGSMNGIPYWYLIQAAKEIAQLAKGNYLGIIVFSNFPQWLFPLQKLDNPEVVSDLLDNSFIGGGTIFSLPLAEAFAALKNHPADKKNIIMMSDGDPADFFAVMNFLNVFSEHGISISTIGAGQSVNPQVLETIARRTGGQFYQSPDFSELPGLFKKEFKRISGPPVVEEEFTPVFGSTLDLLSGIQPGTVPSLSGFVVTLLKNRAENALCSTRGEPIIARWRFGLGKAIAFTPDLLPYWTKSWAKWDGLGIIFRNIIKDISQGNKNEVFVSISQAGTELEISVAPSVGSFQLSKLTLHSGKDKSLAEFDLKSTEDGHYQAILNNLLPGIYKMEIFTVDGKMVWNGSIPVNESTEFKYRPDGENFLRQLSAKSGGKFYNGLPVKLDSSFQEKDFRGYISLWSYLLFPALILYLIDIYLRKSGFFSVESLQEKASKEDQSSELYIQLAKKFRNLAEEASMKGDETEAKKLYLRAKAFFIKARSEGEARLAWEKYKRLGGGSE
ncbi:MAG: VWA domain-containing protein [Candidatus Riflebacteria bacterium]|nr:VWA domain-containing protein [Candidatus Riflebacteria bacterium]